MHDCRQFCLPQAVAKSSVPSEVEGQPFDELSGFSILHFHLRWVESEQNPAYYEQKNPQGFFCAKTSPIIGKSLLVLR